MGIVIGCALVCEVPNFYRQHWRIEIILKKCAIEGERHDLPSKILSAFLKNGWSLDIVLNRVKIILEVVERWFPYSCTQHCRAIVRENCL